MAADALGYSFSNFIIQRQDQPHPDVIPTFYQPGFFFNESIHLSQQTGGAYSLVTAVNSVTGLADARCAVFLNTKTEVALSPIAAPFGSVEFSETLPDYVIDRLLDVLIDSANQARASAIRIVNYPHCYAPVQAKRLTQKLLKHGFQIIREAVNQHIPVTPSSFAPMMASSERRRLHKCHRSGFRFQQWTKPDPNVVTTFLVETRRLQNYRLTITPEQLTHLLTTFPDQFGVFVVTDGSAIAALTITVRVRHDILYTFLPASHPGYHQFSPMVMLINGLYAYCQRQQIQVLDLGVSLDHDGQPKPSLIRFKAKLGALASRKLEFEKIL